MEAQVSETFLTALSAPSSTLHQDPTTTDFFALTISMDPLTDE